MFRQNKNNKNINVNTEEDKGVNVAINNNNKDNKKGNKTMTKDATFEAMNENKIQKSARNNTILANALKRAKKGDFDEDLNEVKGMDLLKVTEIFSIREIFSIEEGKTFFKLYKEVFYINDPHKYYFETVEPTVYRRISGQHEQGDEDWAKAVAKEMGIEIIRKS